MLGIGSTVAKRKFNIAFWSTHQAMVSYIHSDIYIGKEKIKYSSGFTLTCRKHSHRCKRCTGRSLPHDVPATDRHSESLHLRCVIHGTRTRHKTTIYVTLAAEGLRAPQSTAETEHMQHKFSILQQSYLYARQFYFTCLCPYDQSLMV
jgi:hypothetical protein